MHFLIQHPRPDISFKSPHKCDFTARRFQWELRLHERSEPSEDMAASQMLSNDDKERVLTSEGINECGRSSLCSDAIRKQL